jgi:response regulator RpfG family c-di-GMP phosphodiesterase
VKSGAVAGDLLMHNQTESMSRFVTVVDDESSVREVLIRAAQLRGYECQTASCAESGLDLLSERLSPVVVTDLRMPGKGGVWLVQEIRRRWPDVAIIVITAGEDQDAASACLQAGAHHYFIKPVNLDEFYHVLEMARRTYLLHRQNKRYRRHLERTVCRQTHKIRRTFFSAIDSLVMAMEERDSYTAGHSHRVRRYVLKLGKALQFKRKVLRQLSLAARLHDIGKVGVPEAVLNKPGPLTEEEFHLVRQHPGIGERLCRRIVRSPDILAGIRSHHERLNGSGYPDGLRGDRIPLLAKLIAIADSFDALTSSRSYHAARTAEEAFRELEAGSGTLYEPEFVRAFIEYDVPLSRREPVPATPSTPIKPIRR